MTNNDKSLLIDVNSTQLEVFCKKVISRSRNTAGTHEALDFKKANIKIEEYQAMTDIAYFFKHT